MPERELSMLIYVLWTRVQRGYAVPRAAGAGRVCISGIPACHHRPHYSPCTICNALISTLQRNSKLCAFDQEPVSLIRGVRSSEQPPRFFMHPTALVGEKAGPLA